MILVDVITTGYCRKKYFVDTGETFDSLADMSEGSRVAVSTICSRLKRCGGDYSKVLEESTHSVNVRTERQESVRITPWDRKRCKRDRVLCKSYHDCQSSRLGLPGAAVWVAPDDTDKCYVPESVIKHKYVSPFAGCRVGVGR